MSTGGTLAIIAQFSFIIRQLNRYIPLTFLVLGTIGNVFNFIIFNRPILRLSACSFYFKIASVVNFVSLYVGLITPFLGIYGLDPTQHFVSLCKIRFYLRFSTITLSNWFILFACVDRFLSSSPNAQRRSWSSIRLAKRTIFISTLICFVGPYTQVFFCYVINQQNVCTTVNDLCKATTDTALLIFNSGLPPALMVLFSLLTVRNVKNSPIVAQHHQHRNIQLIRILSIQVIVLVSFAIPITGQKLYDFSTLFKTRSTFDLARDNLINQIATEISYISNSMTFYVFSLTSKTFRREVFRVISSLRRKDNQIEPLTLTVTRLR